MQTPALFFQLFETESSTYTYLVADPQSKEAILIDPVLETLERDLALLREHGLKLRYVMDTHVHADHVTAAARLKERTGAQTAISRAAGVVSADIALVDGQELSFGNRKIKALATPGHTDSCMSFLFEDKVFTGDALLIRGNGRTDFQQGSAETLYRSVYEKLFSLPDPVTVYPAHDYKGQMSSTIGEEKSSNPGLAEGFSKEQFCEFMAQKKLALPKKIHIAVPANLAGGVLPDHGDQ